MDQASNPTSRKRRWLRRGLFATLLAVGMVGIVLWVVTRSWFILAQVRPELAAKLGGDVAIASASYDGAGRFLLRDVVLRAPHHSGEAGEILQVSLARIRVDEWRLLRGEVHLEEVHLDGVLLRLAEDAQNAGSFTFMALDPTWDVEGPEAISTLPRIEVRNAVVEYGSHDENGYSAVGHRRLAGLMQPHKDGQRIYDLHLVEIDSKGDDAPEGISVVGEWNVETNEHSARAAGVVLNEAAYNMVPKTVRWWWDHMNLEGRLANARFEWRDGAPLAVAFDIENVGLTLPIETDEGPWARYHAGQVVGHGARPRLNVHSGSIRFSGDAIEFDNLVGELRSEELFGYEAGKAVSVPYEVRVNIRDIGPVDWENREAWIDRMIATVPFEMEFSVRDFQIAPDEEGNLPPVDLPLPVAQALERFLLKDFALTTSVTVRREADQDIAMTGSVSIRNATGGYEEFPYPLRGIDAELTFDNEQVRIKSLRGLAPSGVAVHLEGTITPPGRFAEIELSMRSERIPVDEDLREAMRYRGLGFFDALMNVPAEQALRASGRLDDLNNFELAGEVGLDLRISRALGPDQPTEVTGLINIHSLGMVYEHFPYPFTAIGGSLRLEPAGVSIVEDEHGRGVPMVTIGGGEGYVSGGVRAVPVDGRLQVLPDLRISLTGDTMNPAITAAIPPGRERPDDSTWPGGEVTGPVALLESARFSGKIDYEGHVYTGEHGDVQYTFDVNFQGHAQPGEELSERLGEAGLIWPPDLLIEDATAHVRVSHEGITLVGFEGSHEHGLIGAAGTIDWSGEHSRTELDIELIDLVLGRYLIDLMPNESVDAVVRLWERYEPSGHFNAKLEFRSLGDEIEPPRLLIDPSRARLTIEDEPIVLTRESGGLTLIAGRVAFDDLAIQFLRERDQQRDGTVTFNGSYGLEAAGAGEQDLAIQGRWSDGRFDSPIIIEALRLIEAERHIQEFERLQPRGEFNAEFSYVSAHGSRPSSYDLTLEPRTLAFEFDGRTIEAELHTGSHIGLGEDRIDLHRLSGVLGGEVFSLKGVVLTAAPLTIDLEELRFDGRLMNEHIQSLLPQEVRDLLQTLAFADGPRTMVENGRLTLIRSEGDGEVSWKSSFHGSLHTNGASFQAVVDIEDFDGTVLISFESGHQAEDYSKPHLKVEVHGDQLSIAGRRLTDLRASGITLSEDGRSLLVPDIQADCYGGRLWAEAQVGLEGGEAYEARLELVGASVAGIISGEQEPSRPGVRPRRQGTVNAGLRVAGITGVPSTRTGRGVLRAVGGSLESVPLILQLMQVLQLTVPLRSALDHAHVELVIDGDTAVFERILLESTVLGDIVNLQLFGDGEMDLQTYELRTQFRSRGGTLLIRDLVGGLGDQLYAVEIVGTLGNPRARIVALPGLAQQSSRQRPAVQEPAAAVEAEGQP